MSSRFWGVAHYYCPFISKYAEIAAPLTYLMKKDVEMQWDPPQQWAFQQLKGALCNTPMLVFPDPKLPYKVVTGALGIVVGLVLMQGLGDDPCPIAFMSRALKPTKQQYSAYERELMAIVYYFIHWRYYLEGCIGGVIVITNHQPLTHLMEQSVLSWL